MTCERQTFTAKVASYLLARAGEWQALGAAGLRPAVRLGPLAFVGLLVGGGAALVQETVVPAAAVERRPAAAADRLPPQKPLHRTLSDYERVGELRFALLVRRWCTLPLCRACCALPLCRACCAVPAASASAPGRRRSTPAPTGSC